MRSLQERPLSSCSATWGDRRRTIHRNVQGPKRRSDPRGQRSVCSATVLMTPQFLQPSCRSPGTSPPVRPANVVWVGRARKLPLVWAAGAPWRCFSTVCSPSCGETLVWASVQSPLTAGIRAVSVQIWGQVRVLRGGQLSRKRKAPRGHIGRLHQQHHLVAGLGGVHAGSREKGHLRRDEKA